MGKKRNRTQNSALNMGVGMISQTINLLLGFISRSVFIHFLSAEYLGINGLLLNVLTVLSFAELGIGEAMTYAMYKPAKENDKNTMKQLMEVYKKAYTIIGLTVGAIGIVLSFFLNFFVSEPPKIPESLQIIFMFYTANNVLSYFLTYKKSILIANQENYIVTITAQIITVVQYILQIAVLACTKQYYLYLTVQIICTVANNIMVSIIVGNKYPWLKGRAKDKLPKETLSSIYKNIKSLSVAKIAGVVSNGADNIIISKLIGLTSVGLVSNYTLITNSLNGILWNGLSSITSSFGNFNVDSSVERRRDLFDEIYLCSYWLYGFLSVGVVTLANPLIEIWLGKDFLLSPSVVFSLVLIVYVSGVNFPVYTFQTTLGMYKEMKYPYLASGILNVVLSIIWGLKFGLIGIYLATSVSRLLTSELFGGYYVYKRGLELSPWKYAFKYLLSLLFLAVNIFIANTAISFVSIGGIYGFLIKTLVCIFVCNIIYFLIFFRTPTFKRLKNRILNLINIKTRNSVHS